MRTNSEFVRRILLILVALALLGGTPSQAGEVTLQNDSSPAAGGGTSLPQLVSGEQVGVWLTTASAGDIVAVQVDWRSTVGGAPSSIETAIHIYAASSRRRFDSRSRGRQACGSLQVMEESS